MLNQKMVALILLLMKDSLHPHSFSNDAPTGVRIINNVTTVYPVDPTNFIILELERDLEIFNLILDMEIILKYLAITMNGKNGSIGYN